MCLSTYDPHSRDAQLQSIRPHALFSFGPSLSFPNCSYRSWSRHQIIDRSLLLLSMRFLGQDQLLRMSRTLHQPAPDPLLCPIDRRYGQEGWYPRRYPTTRLAALDAEWIPDCKGTSRCVMTTLHLGRGDRGKENAVSPLALRCLDPNSRSVLRCRFGRRNKDSMSLDCVALVHPTLLPFIEY